MSRLMSILLLFKIKAMLISLYRFSNFFFLISNCLLFFLIGLQIGLNIFLLNTFSFVLSDFVMGNAVEHHRYTEPMIWLEHYTYILLFLYS